NRATCVKKGNEEHGRRETDRLQSDPRSPANFAGETLQQSAKLLEAERGSRPGAPSSPLDRCHRDRPDRSPLLPARVGLGHDLEGGRPHARLLVSACRRGNQRDAEGRADGVAEARRMEREIMTEMSEFFSG